MSKFYITLPGDAPSSISSTNNILGEVSFNNFWAESGFRALQNIVNKYPDVLKDIRIFDDFKKQYSVEEFLDTINGKKLILG